MSDNPLVSVVIPVYNGEKYLADALESILTQTYQNLEIIIVDDCSSDDSASIVRNVSSDKIQLLQNPETLGVSYSRNKGIRQAEGKYIALMDADDISLPKRIEKQVAFLESNTGIGLISSSYQTFENEIHNGKRSLKKLPCDADYLNNWLVFKCLICCPAVMMRASLVKKHHLYFDESLSHCEDWELWSRFSRVTKISNIEDVLLLYRKHGNNSSRKREKMYLGTLEVISRNLFVHGVDISEFFSEEKKISSVEVFEGLVNRLKEQSNTELSLVSPLSKEGCAYLAYELFKKNEHLLRGKGLRILKKSGFSQYIKIPIKKRIRYLLGNYDG